MFFFLIDILICFSIIFFMMRGFSFDTLHQEKTASGKTRSDLMKNKRNKVVSKKQNAAGKKAYANIWAHGETSTRCVRALDQSKVRKIHGVHFSWMQEERWKWLQKSTLQLICALRLMQNDIPERLMRNDYPERLMQNDGPERLMQNDNTWRLMHYDFLEQCWQ